MADAIEGASGLMAAKGKGSGLGARMAAAPASGRGGGRASPRRLARTCRQAAEPEAPAKGEVVALNIRLPKDLHRTLRQIAFDEESSINALLIQAAEKMLAERE